METLTHTLDSLWQVVLVGLLLGAGLPAIFALGLRALSTGDIAEDGTVRARPAAATAAGILCFAVVVVAIVAGILFIMKNFLDSTFGISVF
ncbi:hypothetical protein CH289_14710 [Rhodococcus sp. RS1C4]|uniref:hypothetical protein n=1 Tax=Nocardiaceae TaxID=85025 RepID=UPI00036ACCBD|nr:MULTISPECIES: hypothetical protein [Rhodococcus]OZC51263.1 hypothetical protein CH289_14710 [Rhodococcus sp. RS1C4]OZC57255.1 hypothetical protein CH267_08350 [Rhodococcus sp. 06-621-2]OZC91209.1 hypothetical protein CH282_02665 [Rhodococcus sp. 06-418-1B]OZD10739.1 hypothetical protein CH280_21940 [Rhodococcus sp. 06-156-4C]OZD23200.1 hypothetical protein CH253_12680 [Rhodococcus sp. 06-156-3C]